MLRTAEDNTARAARIPLDTNFSCVAPHKRLVTPAHAGEEPLYRGRVLCPACKARALYICEQKTKPAAPRLSKQLTAEV